MTWKFREIWLKGIRSGELRIEDALHQLESIRFRATDEEKPQISNLIREIQKKLEEQKKRGE